MRTGIIIGVFNLVDMLAMVVFSFR